MLKISIQILVLILFFNTNDSIGQEVDSSFIKDIENFQIDTAEIGRINRLIDSFEDCDNYQTKFYDNIIIELSGGERVLTIEKQECDKLAKYVLNTDRVGTNLDVKSIIIYESMDTLVKAEIYYHEDRNQNVIYAFYKNWNFFFGTGGLIFRDLSDEKNEEYVNIAKRLSKIR